MLSINEVQNAIRTGRPVRTPDGAGRATGYRPIPETPNAAVRVRLDSGRTADYAQDRIAA